MMQGMSQGFRRHVPLQHGAALAAALWVVLWAGAAAQAVASDAARSDPTRSDSTRSDSISAEEWLTRMNDALTTRNYEGTFFHVRPQGVETLRIVHRVKDGETKERLVSLDGSGREFIHDRGELICYLPDQRKVLVERGRQNGSLLGAVPRFDSSISGSYEIKGGERERLMGRDARLVIVHPRDEYRYGYRLWIDERTAMPLKTQLCDSVGNVVEQVVFSSLTMRSEIPDSAFKPDVQAEGFRWVRQEVDSPELAKMPVLWHALRLPPGFRMASRIHQALPGAASPVAHLVFTDGVASVSVFVEAASATNRDGVQSSLTGARRVGASAAFSTTVNGHQVTAVGEVPLQTVQFIASQVKFESSSAATPAATPAAPPIRRKPNPPPAGVPALAPRN